MLYEQIYLVLGTLITSFVLTNVTMIFNYITKFIMNSKIIKVDEIVIDTSSASRDIIEFIEWLVNNVDIESSSANSFIIKSISTKDMTSGSIGSYKHHDKTINITKNDVRVENGNNSYIYTCYIITGYKYTILNNIIQELYTKFKIEKDNNYKGLETIIYYDSSSSCFKLSIPNLDYEIDDLLMTDSDIKYLNNDIEHFIGLQTNTKQITKRGYLFHGKPGNGKTSFIRYIANKIHCANLYVINIKSFYKDSELLQTMQKISADKSTKIILYEDIDVMFDSSYNIITNVDDSPVSVSDVYKPKSISLSLLLNILDGLFSLNNTITIMTTNYPEKINKVLIRPGRIDVNFEFKNANKEVIHKIYKKNKNMDIDIENIVYEDYTDSLSQAINNIDNDINYYIKK